MRWARLLKIAPGDACSVQPHPKGCHGARYLASRNSNPPTDAFLVRLRPAQRDQHALSRFLEILDVQGHELAPAEGTGKAEKDDCPVAEGAERRCHRRMAMTMSAVAALFLTRAAPVVRRSPGSTAFPFSSLVGVS